MIVLKIGTTDISSWEWISKESEGTIRKQGKKKLANLRGGISEIYSPPLWQMFCFGHINMPTEPSLYNITKQLGEKRDTKILKV